MTFLCMTALRNKTVAHTFLPSFDNANGRVCQERLLRSRNFATMVTCRAVKKFLSSRLIMNTRQLWNAHQRHKFLRAEVSGDILKFRISEMTFAGVFKRCFPPRTPMLFRQNSRRTRNYAVEMSQAFHDIARFERFTDLNLFKNALSVIQNWETNSLQFNSTVLNFCYQL